MASKKTRLLSFIMAGVIAGTVAPVQLSASAADKVAGEITGTKFSVEEPGAATPVVELRETPSDIVIWYNGGKGLFNPAGTTAYDFKTRQVQAYLNTINGYYNVTAASDYAWYVGSAALAASYSDIKGKEISADGKTFVATASQLGLLDASGKKLLTKNEYVSVSKGKVSVGSDKTKLAALASTGNISTIWLARVDKKTKAVTLIDGFQVTVRQAPLYLGFAANTTSVTNKADLLKTTQLAGGSFTSIVPVASDATIFGNAKKDSAGAFATDSTFSLFSDSPNDVSFATSSAAVGEDDTSIWLTKLKVASLSALQVQINIPALSPKDVDDTLLKAKKKVLSSAGTTTVIATATFANSAAKTAADTEKLILAYYTSIPAAPAAKANITFASERSGKSAKLAVTAYNSIYKVSTNTAVADTVGAALTGYLKYTASLSAVYGFDGEKNSTEIAFSTTLDLGTITGGGPITTGKYNKTVDATWTAAGAWKPVTGAPSGTNTWLGYTVSTPNNTAYIDLDSVATTTLEKVLAANAVAGIIATSSGTYSNTFNKGVAYVVSTVSSLTGLRDAKGKVKAVKDIAGLDIAAGSLAANITAKVLGKNNNIVSVTVKSGFEPTLTDVAYLVWIPTQLPIGAAEEAIIIPFTVNTSVNYKWLKDYGLATVGATALVSSLTSTASFSEMSLGAKASFTDIKVQLVAVASGTSYFKTADNASLTSSFTDYAQAVGSVHYFKVTAEATGSNVTVTGVATNGYLLASDSAVSTFANLFDTSKWTVEFLTSAVEGAGITASQAVAIPAKSRKATFYIKATVK
ncbi:MAG: hypothetical protein LBN40_06395 [Oscillospiraceae bacterium]|jgi:hypothetical protein|nr:hypothetical protein [Oscillospiraceae bacterium]